MRIIMSIIKQVIITNNSNTYNNSNEHNGSLELSSTSASGCHVSGTSQARSNETISNITTTTTTTTTTNDNNNNNINNNNNNNNKYK